MKMRKKTLFCLISVWACVANLFAMKEGSFDGTVHHERRHDNLSEFQNKWIEFLLAHEVVTLDREAVVFSDGSLEFTTVAGDVFVLRDEELVIYPHEGGQIILDDNGRESQERVVAFIARRV